VIRVVRRSAAVESRPSPSGIRPQTTYWTDITFIATPRLDTLTFLPILAYLERRPALTTALPHDTHLPYRSNATARGLSRFHMILFCFTYSTIQYCTGYSLTVPCDIALVTFASYKAGRERPEYTIYICRDIFRLPFVCVCATSQLDSPSRLLAPCPFSPVQTEMNTMRGGLS
jgi:hypothetical protein